MTRVASALVSVGPAARAVLIGLAVAVAAMLGWYAASWTSLGADVRPAVLAGYADGQLRDGDKRINDTDLGAQQFNDCLILDMAMDQRGPRTLLAVSPSYGYSTLGDYSTGDGPCANADRMAHSFAGRPQTYYHNYIHGQVPLTRFLSPLGVKGMRALYKGSLTAIVMIGLAISLAGLAMSKDMAFWVVFFAVTSRWFGLETFGQSLGHGPSDIVFLGFALFLAIATFLGGVRPWSLTIAAAIFGALTAIFEMLSGGIPLGLALVLGATLIVSDARPLDIAAGYCAAVLGCLAIKVGLVVHFFGVPALRPALTELSARFAGAPSGETAVNTSLSAWLHAVARSTDAMAAGLPNMALIMVLMALVAGAWGLSRNRSPRAVWLAISTTPVVGWLLIFRQHTIVHAWFMDRILVWLIVGGFCLFQMELGDLNRPNPAAYV